MKKSLRFASAALALTLAAGMTLPAFAAAKADYSKDETVYAVMNADGSIKSTTVSEHLYSASGLSNVTDESTLTDIQNTESDAAFTQDGEKLVWNTDDTDVYYKGNTDKALPITANVTYTLGLLYTQTAQTLHLWQLQADLSTRQVLRILLLPALRRRNTCHRSHPAFRLLLLLL